MNSYFFTGTSSPSKLILNLMPTLNPILLDARYLFRLTMYWLWLNLRKHTKKKQLTENDKNSYIKRIDVRKCPTLVYNTLGKWN